ncbi:MAG: TIGR01777 family oxidoreductase [Cyanobacteria bacterium HKST-UBA04]|nr:TIGR01777 family oxidoreductase [Cyanobacteria bacterium HKST-UBA04]MCA9840952.1 TIGR01777 family oxidoreductase [Cyanobacteria bacterium HKST-UBA03]
MKTMKILVSGASGLVGTALVRHLKQQGHRVIALTRSTPGQAADGQVDGQVDTIAWAPAQDWIDQAALDALEGLDAVVHLAGENIASGRWSPAKKSRIRSSRVEATALLAKALAACKQPPATFISASAIGFYGEGHNLDETSRPGTDFLAQTCAAWEAASEPLAGVGTRQVWLRLGIVLSPDGGALKQMLPVFRLGGGGPLGSGQQYMSWVSLQDVVRVIEFALVNEGVVGVYNTVSPNPVTNKTFTQALGKAVHRPAFFPVPAFVIGLIFGEMGQTLLLGSAQVFPRRLQEAGYTFEHPDIGPALQALLSG